MGTCVDLFTGIGGFVLALHDLYSPLAYCEIRPTARRVLLERMLDGTIPTAPIVEDVADTDKIVDAVGGEHVHLLTAGFPCVGFSVAGSRQGLSNHQSGLFSSILNVMKAIRPAYVFLENVPAILTNASGADFAEVTSSLADLGYDLRWTVLSARDVGAPQLRRRWFCLCARRDESGCTWPSPPPGDALTPSCCSSWSTVVPPLTVTKLPEHPRRFHMLGNAVVPMQARRAYQLLCHGLERDTSSRALRDVSKKHPDHGSTSDGRKYTPHVLPNSALAPPEPRTIILDPTWHTPSRAYQYAPHRVRLPSLTGPITRSSWPTPRSSCASSSCVLNMRTIRDLATMAIFTRSVDGDECRRTVEEDGVNPMLVEWIMGFPLGHTEAN